MKYAEWSEITGLLTDDQLDCRVMESLEKEVNVISVNTEEKE